MFSLSYKSLGILAREFVFVNCRMSFCVVTNLVLKLECQHLFFPEGCWPLPSKAKILSQLADDWLHQFKEDTIQQDARQLETNCSSLLLFLWEHPCANTFLYGLQLYGNLLIILQSTPVWPTLKTLCFSLFLTKNDLKRCRYAIYVYNGVIK